MGTGELSGKPEEILGGGGGGEGGGGGGGGDYLSIDWHPI